ncbi:MAG: hypothetical protein KQH83_02805 [Actinobacteria bacterium]|nr:hypothetical protein [Actinomycetota bacterium]
MPILFSGQPAVTSGWYVDEHGHRLLLRPGEPAPLCAMSGATPVRWRLVRPIPLPARDL